MLHNPQRSSILADFFEVYAAVRERQTSRPFHCITPPKQITLPNWTPEARMLLNHNETSSLITAVKPQRKQRGESEHERVSLMYRFNSRIQIQLKKNILNTRGCFSRHRIHLVLTALQQKSPTDHLSRQTSIFFHILVRVMSSVVVTVPTFQYSVPIPVKIHGSRYQSKTQKHAN